jgi:5-methylcytosine-specific restriction endonuclease McrA
MRRKLIEYYIIKHRQWRKRIAKKQSNHCYYCSTTFDDNNLQLRCTLDHFLPISLGGIDDRKNTVAACFRCNNRKDNLHPKDFPASDEFSENYQKRLYKLYDFKRLV